MFGSAILEVIIGLALIYLLLSMMCSALNEWLAGILQLRSTTLRDGIMKLLNDPNGEALAKHFFAHPLIRGLATSAGGFPSYISARTFARVLIDLVAPADGQQPDLRAIYTAARAKIAELAGRDDELGRVLLILINEAGVDPQRLEESAKMLQQLEQTRLGLLDFVARAGNEIAQIEYAATTLEKLAELEATLKQTEEAANAKLLQAQANVETYFNEAMERLSGWYKRRVQVIIFGLALVVSLLLNVDTLAIASDLATDPARRAALVAVAEGVQPLPERVDDPLATVAELNSQLADLGIPLGWAGLPTGVGGWGLKVLGLLVSAFAIAQGAPFWFELLGKLLNVRMTGKKPEADGRVRG
jgi:molecular chaperone GrpE (heat shock protein)